jgi:hypothetical protein
MADILINQLTEIVPTATQYAIVDPGDGYYKKAQVGNFPGGGGGLTTLFTPTLTATPSSSTQMNLSWTNVANESSYKLEWSPNGSTGWAQIGGTIAANTTTYNHTGLTASTAYYYRITAMGDGLTYSNSGFGTANGTTSAGSSYDTDAQTYFTAVEAAGGTISSGFKTAWNDFVVSQKGTDGSWAKFQLVNPLLGGTLNGARINAKTPGTFDLTWTGSPTVSATGVNYSGTSQFGDTGWVGSSGNVSDADGFSMGFYGRENAQGYDMGVYESGKEFLCLPNADGVYKVMAAGGGFYLDSVELSTAGFIYINKPASGGLMRMYRNGTGYDASAHTLINTGTLPIYVGAANDATDVYSTNEHAFYFIGKGLTSAEATKLDTDVATLMTALSRNV